MKKLDQFILRSFIGPFIAILLVVVFILMMQFLWLYIDELVGKGLSFKVILEFLGWGSATLLPLSLPLATLLASMMTLGTLGENNELLAIKAAGISLQRVLIPLCAVCMIVSIGAFFVSNDLIPVAYNKIYTLRDDIGKTKEEIKIPTKTFYNGIEGYILRVNERNDETELEVLDELLTQIVQEAGGLAKYKQFYYPMASRIFAYEPTVKASEVLSDKFKAGNWFLPSAGEMARLCWYHFQGYAGAENAIFTNAVRANIMTAFGNSWYGCSSEYIYYSYWVVHFSSGSCYGTGKGTSYVARGLVAF